MKRSVLITFLISMTLNVFAQLHIDFSSFDHGHEFTRSSWMTAGADPRWVNGFDQQRAFIDGTRSVSGDRSLKIEFPASGVGPMTSGAQAPLRLQPKDEYYVSYWLRFSENFSWGARHEGGKLPGLAGGSNCSGCNTCTGTNGFSARLMWRRSGKAVLYLYEMDRSSSCGVDHELKHANGDEIIFNRGTWYNIVQRVRVNTADNNDGVVEIWVNGENALLLEGLRFVNNGDKVDNFYFSTFHGGASADWAPGVDCHIWFDDIVISSDPADVFKCKAPDLGPDRNIAPDDFPVMLDTRLSENNRSFTWYKDGMLLEERSAVLKVFSPGHYKVEVESIGCTETDEVMITTTITDIFNVYDNGLSLYPNPFLHVISLRHGVNEQAEIEIVGVDGIVYEKHILNESGLELGNYLEPGIYFIHYSVKSIKKTIKVIKL